MNRLLTLFFAISCLFSWAQQEPQFKFYLAFEDANQERDTIWFGLDTQATTGLKDTIFNERKVQLDTNKFQVYYRWTKDSSFVNKTVISPRSGSKNYVSSISSVNAVAPVTVRWDTNLIVNHDLPFQLRQAYVENVEISALGFPAGYDLIGQTPRLYGDSIVLYGVFEEDHWLFTLILSETESSVGIKDFFIHPTYSIQVFPNPASDFIQIETEQHIQKIAIFNSIGQRIETFDNQNFRGSSLDVSSLTTGTYTLQLITPKSIHYARFSKY
jgi:hypothetical protein